MRISCTLLFAFSIFLFAQKTTGQDRQFHPCGTQDGKVEWLKNYQADPGHFPVGNDTLYVPMSIHIVGTTGGTGFFSMRQLLDAFCTLNEDFAPSKIRFFIAGEINYISNTTYYDHTFGQGEEMMEIYRVPNTINTYFVDSPAGNCGYSSYNLGIAMAKSCSGATDHTWAHEVGHFLSLPHPFWGWEGHDDYDYSQPAPLQWDDTLVERLDGVDCHLAADGFCDTPPDYLNYRWSCNNNNESTVTQTDPNGETFVSDGTLFMSYALDGCMGRFSEEQSAAMRANLLTEKAEHLQTDLPHQPIDAGSAVFVAPAEGELLNYHENIYFEWEPIPNATGYVLEITIFTPFNSGLFNYVITEGTSFTVPTLPKNKTIYWRLRPFNGSFTCVQHTAIATFETGEEVNAVNALDEIAGMGLQPNPVRAGAGLLISLESTEAFSAEMSVANVAGKAQLVGNQFFTAGKNQLEISTTGLAPGIYFLQLRSERGLLSRKFVVW